MRSCRFYSCWSFSRFLRHWLCFTAASILHKLTCFSLRCFHVPFVLPLCCISGQHIHKFPNTSTPFNGLVDLSWQCCFFYLSLLHTRSKSAELFTVSIVLPFFRNLLPICHVCTEDGEKPMVLLPFMAWGNLKLFLRQCKLAEANNPQVRRLFTVALSPSK